MMKLDDQFNMEFAVTEKIYHGFMGVFEDKNCLHTAKDFAVSKGFKDVVMHGNILNGFISYFIGECLPLKNVIIHSQDIKYSKPVYLNNLLKFNAVITDVISSVNVYIFSFYFENDEKIKVAKGKVQIGVL